MLWRCLCACSVGSRQRLQVVESRKLCHMPHIAYIMVACVCIVAACMFKVLCVSYLVQVLQLGCNICSRYLRIASHSQYYRISHLREKDQHISSDFLFFSHGRKALGFVIIFVLTSFSLFLIVQYSFALVRNFYTAFFAALIMSPKFWG